MGRATLGFGRLMTVCCIMASCATVEAEICLHAPITFIRGKLSITPKHVTQVQSLELTIGFGVVGRGAGQMWSRVGQRSRGSTGSGCRGVIRMFVAIEGVRGVKSGGQGVVGFRSVFGFGCSPIVLACFVLGKPIGLITFLSLGAHTC